MLARILTFFVSTAIQVIFDAVLLLLAHFGHSLQCFVVIFFVLLIRLELLPLWLCWLPVCLRMSGLLLLFSMHFPELWEKLWFFLPVCRGDTCHPIIIIILIVKIQFWSTMLILSLHKPILTVILSVSKPWLVLRACTSRAVSILQSHGAFWFSQCLEIADTEWGRGSASVVLMAAILCGRSLRYETFLVIVGNYKGRILS